MAASDDGLFLLLKPLLLAGYRIVIVAATLGFTAPSSATRVAAAHLIIATIWLLRNGTGKHPMPLVCQPRYRQRAHFYASAMGPGHKPFFGTDVLAWSTPRRIHPSVRENSGDADD